MPHASTLLFLHGVGSGDQEDTWRESLDEALARLGYPDLSEINVIAPKYPNGLNGVDDDEPLPKVTVKALRGDDAKRARRESERRRTALEVMLGPDDRGNGIPGGDRAAPVVAGTKKFRQAKNYVENPRIRAWVLQRILRKLPQSGRVVIVGHSLGSIIAADLVRRLPVGLEVAGLVTIGSPIAHPFLHVDGLRDLLKDPPSNVAWWVNLWSRTDPVPAGRGASTLFPWILDQRVPAASGPHQPRRNHAATTYLETDKVATAIGFGLFGSRSKEIVLAQHGVDVPLEGAETLTLLAFRYAHLTSKELEGDKRDRYVEALRQVQATTVERMIARRVDEGRPLPRSIVELKCDLADPDSLPPAPKAPSHLDIEGAVVPLAVIAAENVIRPFEIDVPHDDRRRAMEQLTLEMGLGRALGANVFEAMDRARKALKGPNWMRWTALGIGAALVAATGGLALAAAPGVAGAAAVTSALAAFGPGGMIGGLLTAGTLLSAGSGSIAIGLASSGTSAEAVEAVVAGQLTMAILRNLQKLDQDPNTWAGLAESKVEMTRELTRQVAVSDESAGAVKELKRKLEIVRRGISYLERHGLGPESDGRAGLTKPTE